MWNVDVDCAYPFSGEAARKQLNIHVLKIESDRQYKQVSLIRNCQLINLPYARMQLMG